MPKYYATVYLWEVGDNPGNDVVIASKDTQPVTAETEQQALSLLGTELIQQWTRLRQSVIVQTQEIKPEETK